MKKNHFYYILTTITSLLVLLILPACGRNRDTYAQSFLVYYINNEETGIVTREYRTNSTDIETQVDELIGLLGTIPERLEYKVPLSGAFKLLDYSISDGKITLNFNDHYYDLPFIKEILVRAVLVRTLNQVVGIDNVVMTIRGEPLIDGTGNIVGPMNEDMFIDNIGSELNAYARTSLRLYFADENEDRLTIIARNDVIYHSNTAVERLVVETLIAGPYGTELARATVNPLTRVLGVTTTDGTCYVNLDEHFGHLLSGVNADMVIYSITNSLIELPNVNRVRISLNGEAGTVFEAVNLATVFERNLDIVK